MYRLVGYIYFIPVLVHHIPVLLVLELRQALLIVFMNIYFVVSQYFVFFFDSPAVFLDFLHLRLIELVYLIGQIFMSVHCFGDKTFQFLFFYFHRILPFPLILSQYLIAVSHTLFIAFFHLLTLLQIQLQFVLSSVHFQTFCFVIFYYFHFCSFSRFMQRAFKTIELFRISLYVVHCFSRQMVFTIFLSIHFIISIYLRILWPVLFIALSWLGALLFLNRMEQQFFIFFIILESIERTCLYVLFNVSLGNTKEWLPSMSGSRRWLQFNFQIHDVIFNLLLIFWHKNDQDHDHNKAR